MAVTVTYLNVAPGTTPPTYLQALGVNAVVATVAFGTDADAAAVISHNFSFSDADLAAGWPTVVITPLEVAFGANLFFVASFAADYVGIARGNQSNGGAESIRVTVSRPHSYVR